MSQEPSTPDDASASPAAELTMMFSMSLDKALESLSSLARAYERSVLAPVMSLIERASDVASSATSDALRWIKEEDRRWGLRMLPRGGGDTEGFAPGNFGLGDSVGEQPPTTTATTEAGGEGSVDEVGWPRDALVDSVALPPATLDAAGTVSSAVSPWPATERLREADAAWALRVENAVMEAMGLEVPLPNFLGVATPAVITVGDLVPVLFGAAAASLGLAALVLVAAGEGRDPEGKRKRKSRREQREQKEQKALEEWREKRKKKDKKKGKKVSHKEGKAKKKGHGLHVETSEQGTALALGALAAASPELAGNPEGNAKELEAPDAEDSEDSDTDEGVVRGGPAPLKILGPSVTTLDFITSAPPPAHPAVFASSKYRSIRRKLIIDVRELTLSRCVPRDHPIVEKKRRRKRVASLDDQAGGGAIDSAWANEPLTHGLMMAGTNATTRTNFVAAATSTFTPREDPYKPGPALSNFIDAGTGTKIGQTLVPGGKQATLNHIPAGSGDGSSGVGTAGGDGGRQLASDGASSRVDDGKAGGGVGDDGIDDDPIESTIPISEQTYHPDPRPVPIKAVLNATAVPPRAGGVLEITVSESWKRAYDADNLFLLDVVTEENWMEHGGKLTDPIKNIGGGESGGPEAAKAKGPRGYDPEAEARRASAWMDGGTVLAARKFGTDGLTVRDSIAARAVGIDAAQGGIAGGVPPEVAVGGGGKEEQPQTAGRGSGDQSNPSQPPPPPPAAIRTVDEEYTFASSMEAADFQSIVLALRIVGKEVRNMYCALELLHMASEAYNNSGEVAWLDPPQDTAEEAAEDSGDGGGEKKDDTDGGGDEKGDGSKDSSSSFRHRPPAGVALNDVLRCLGEVPQVRRMIDRFFAHHYPQLTRGDGSEGDNKDGDEDEGDLLSDAADAAAVTVAGEQGTNDRAALAACYKKTRLLLGYVDFLRLFVPPLDSSGVGTGGAAVPYINPTAAKSKKAGDASNDGDDDGGIDAHKARIVEVMRLRKLVGRAALRVRWYVNGMRVARAGWDVPAPSLEDIERCAAAEQRALDEKSATSSGLRAEEDKKKPPEPVTVRRLAFDDDRANEVRDLTSKNEYYEAIVGHDVQCSVHSARHLRLNGASQPSGRQAYALVGCHSFQLPRVRGSDADKIHPLQAHLDPVQALPSLQSIIGSNPAQDFFVAAFFPETPRVAVVLLFVRTLPPGVDPKFDSVLDTYVNGNSETRDRKLEIFMQLGPGDGLSPLAWAALKVLSAVLSWTRRGEAQIPFESGRGGRTAFPGMTMSRYTNTRHFGGSLLRQADNASEGFNSSRRSDASANILQNYVAVTSHIDGSVISNYAVRILYSRLEDGALPRSTVDFTFVLEGEKEEELPERAMATIRMVHVDCIGVALPIPYSTKHAYTEEEENEIDLGEKELSVPRSEMLSGASDVFSVHTSTLQSRHTDNPSQTVVVAEDKKGGEGGAAGADDEDLDVLTEILDGVTVPVRRDNKFLIPHDISNGNNEFGVMTPKTANRDLRAQSDENPAIVDDADVAGGGAIGPKAFSSIQQKQSKPLHDTINVPVLRNVTRSDLRRFYIASDRDLRTAAVRVVESCAWRGIAFPVDKRVCRVELQSGQFFRQGRDRDGHPVFYFRNMCLGPWRKDVDATVFAVLHRLELAMRDLIGVDPEVRCTLIVLMGKPIDFLTVEVNDDEADDGMANSDGGEGEEDEDKEKKAAKKRKPKKVKQRQRNPFFVGSDPRIDPDEEVQIHTSYALVQRLVEIVSRHYPERLARALVVPSGGWIKTLGTFGLRAYVPAARTRAKVTMLNEAKDLKKFVAEEELVTFAGGKAFVMPAAFEC